MSDHGNNDPNSPGWGAPGGPPPGPPPPVAPGPIAPPGGGFGPPGGVAPGPIAPQQGPYAPNAGYTQQGYGYGYGPVVAQKTNGLAIAGLVCGIVGLLVFAIILGPLALIFGLVALSQINKSQGRQKGKGLAIAAAILGPIDIIAALVIIQTL